MTMRLKIVNAVALADSRVQRGRGNARNNDERPGIVVERAAALALRP